MNKPRTVRVDLHIPYESISYESFPTVLKIYNEALEKVPEKFRDKVQSEIGPYESYGSLGVQLKMHYVRPETEEETAKRIQAEKARKDFDKESKYQTYLKLKKEFEDGK